MDLFSGAYSDENVVPTNFPILVRKKGLSAMFYEKKEGDTALLGLCHPLKSQ